MDALDIRIFRERAEIETLIRVFYGLDAGAITEIGQESFAYNKFCWTHRITMRDDLKVFAMRCDGGWFFEAGRDERKLSGEGYKTIGEALEVCRA